MVFEGVVTVTCCVCKAIICLSVCVRRDIRARTGLGEKVCVWGNQALRGLAVLTALGQMGIMECHSVSCSAD